MRLTCAHKSTAAKTTNDAAFRAKTSPTPIHAMMRPASAGPTTRPMFTLTEPRTEAARISVRGTRSGIIACQAGAVTPLPAPPRKVRRSRTPGVNWPTAAKAARATLTTAMNSWVAIRSSRRSKTSARTPAGSASSTTGSVSAVWTRATRIELFGCETSSHWAPTVSIQFPILLKSTAIQSARKTGFPSGCHVLGDRMPRAIEYTGLVIPR